MMILVFAPLTGSNFLSWGRSVKIALGAKTKLGHIDGTLPSPAPDSPQHGNWKKADCMVLSWLLNSISKDIVESLIFEISWLEIEARFGESNGPMTYQI